MKRMRNRHLGTSAIYGLFDERDCLRYIGMTSTMVDTRYSSHCRSADDMRITRPSVLWIREMAKHGKTPTVRVFERCPNAIARDRELWWIAWAAARIEGLLNEVR